MRILIRPLVEPWRELDVTGRLVGAIAEELWRRYGGNEVLNWLEAERHLALFVSGAPAAPADGSRGEEPARRRPRGSPKRTRTARAQETEQ